MNWKGGMDMFDRTTQDNDLRRAMNACLPGLENKPGFEREVLKRARGEIKVKKKLSVGLVFILILVLAAVTALAATLLTAQQIIQQEVLPLIQTSNHEQTPEFFSNDELAYVVKQAQENGIELSKPLLKALQAGQGYSTQSAIMELASCDFGAYDEWTIQQQYWFEEIMVAIGWKDENLCRLPEQNALSLEQAMSVAEEYVTITYGDDISDTSRWKRSVTYRVSPEAKEMPRWWLWFRPVDLKDNQNQYDLVIKANGQVISCHALPMKTGYGSDVISQYEDVYGSYSKWSPEVWFSFQNDIVGTIPDTRPAYVFQHTKYILPPENGISRETAERVALDTVQMKNTSINHAVCCMDRSIPIWKVEVITQNPTDVGSGKYSAIWLVEIDTLTGKVRDFREFVVGQDLNYLTRWIPWRVYEDIPENPFLAEKE